ncbi:MAG: glycoside hydrolase family 57, partial [Acidobacteria bacterium]|nr:glycoside hydrolase family 57 [Acidobacteriota bacterium]
MAVASITVTSLITREQASFEFSVLHLGETELTGGVRPAQHDGSYERTRRELAEAMQPGGLPAVIRLLDREFASSPISIRSLFRDEQRRILNILCNATLKEAESAFRQLHERYDPLMRFHTRLGIPLPKVLQTAAEFDLNLQLRRILEIEDHVPIAEIEQKLREANDERVSLDASTAMALTAAVERAADRFREDPDDYDRLDLYATLVSVVRSAPVEVSLRKPQNDYYQMKNEIRPRMAESGTNGSGKWLALFDQLGAQLQIAPEARD